MSSRIARARAIHGARLVQEGWVGFFFDAVLRAEGDALSGGRIKAREPHRAKEPSLSI
jgi:hypothetical protein